jgi:hypothetical protein
MHPELTHAERAGRKVTRRGTDSPAAATWRSGPGLPVLLGPEAVPSRPAPAFVEGLGRWLGWQEAIALSTALAQPAATTAAAASAASSLGPALRAQVASERAALEAEFTRVHTAMQHQLVQALDEAQSEAVRAHDGSFLPWRRCCHQLQQQFEVAASALRAQARAALRRLGQATAGTNLPALPHLGELAALDAALAQVLAAREQAQLALLAVLVEPQFQSHLRDLHHLRQKDELPSFRHTLQPLLQADLELRLQPALGLLEALRAAHTRE